MTARTDDAERKPGTFLPGNKANPGGMTADDRAQRDMVRQALVSPEMRAAGLAAYRRLLDADNPLIVKDWADRAAGKAPTSVEVSGKDGEALKAFAEMSRDEVLEVARSGK